MRERATFRESGSKGDCDDSGAVLLEPIGAWTFERTGEPTSAWQLHQPKLQAVAHGKAALRRHKRRTTRPALVELERNSCDAADLEARAARGASRAAQPMHQVPPSAAHRTVVVRTCVKVQLAPHQPPPDGPGTGCWAGSWEKGCVYGRLIVEVGGLERSWGVRGAGLELVPVPVAGRGRERRSLHAGRSFGELGADGSAPIARRRRAWLRGGLRAGYSTLFANTSSRGACFGRRGGLRCQTRSPRTWNATVPALGARPVEVRARRTRPRFRAGKRSAAARTSSAAAFGERADVHRDGTFRWWRRCNVAAGGTANLSMAGPAQASMERWPLHSVAVPADHGSPSSAAAQYTSGVGECRTGHGGGSLGERGPVMGEIGGAFTRATQELTTRRRPRRAAGRAGGAGTRRCRRGGPGEPSKGVAELHAQGFANGRQRDGGRGAPG